MNCDEAEEIGAKIQQSLDDVEFKISKTKRSEKVKTMSSLQNAVKVRDEEVPIDHMTLFTRLVVLVIRENDIALYYFYELLPYSTSLFKNEIMRDPKNSKLREYLTKNINQAKLPGAVVHVIYGGALPHLIQ